MNPKVVALQPPPEWIGHLSGDEFYRVLKSMKRAIKTGGIEKSVIRFVRFMIGVRWHSEGTRMEDEASQKIFDALVKSAGDNRSLHVNCLTICVKKS